MSDLYSGQSTYGSDLKRDRLNARVYPPGYDARDFIKVIDDQGNESWERPGNPFSVDSDGFGYEPERVDEGY